MPQIALLYVNDVSIKGPKIQYRNKEISELSEIQRFIMKHLQNTDYVLTDMKCTELTLTVLKLMFCFLKIKLIKFICDENERYSDSKKIAKIVFFVMINRPLHNIIFL